MRSRISKNQIEEQQGTELTKKGRGAGGDSAARCLLLVSASAWLGWRCVPDWISFELLGTQSESTHQPKQKRKRKTKKKM